MKTPPLHYKGKLLGDGHIVMGEGGGVEFSSL